MTYREAINALTEYAVSGTPFDGVAVLMAVTQFDHFAGQLEKLTRGDFSSESVPKINRSDRVKTGLEIARKAGRFGGRPAKLTEEQRDAAIEELRAGKLQSEVARRFGVNRAMICRLAKNIS